MDYRQLKRWLKLYATEHRIAIPSGFSTRTNRWGPGARKLCRRVQSSAGLPVTGWPDAKTKWLIKPFRAKLLAVATAELGTKEWPPYSNWGEVSKYLAAAGISGSAPWCAAFVTYCMKKAGWDRALPSPPGYVPAWETWARTRGYLTYKLGARRGDLVVFDWDGGTGDHIGIVTSNLGLYKGITTIEGNVSGPNAPGGAVARKTRYWSNVQAVIRLPLYP